MICLKRCSLKESSCDGSRDEYGQISGLIAMEDTAIEELVGNIEDEHDEEEKTTRNEYPLQTFIMDGMTEFSDVKEALSLPVDG